MLQGGALEMAGFWCLISNLLLSKDKGIQPQLTFTDQHLLLPQHLPCGQVGPFEESYCAFVGLNSSSTKAWKYQLILVHVLGGVVLGR